MARKSKRAALVLRSEQRVILKALTTSRLATTSEVERAKGMLGYADGASITELQRLLGFSRATIYRCLDKALTAGVQLGLKNKYHRPYKPQIVEETKAWVVSVACTKPGKVVRIGRDYEYVRHGTVSILVFNCVS